MIRTMLIAAGLFALLLTAALPVHADMARCAECGMMVDQNSPFIAKAVAGTTTSFFCDIGDLFSQVKRKGKTTAALEVKDYATGAWIDAGKAFYVRSEKKFRTPMGWGIAAFKEKSKAAEAGTALDFDGMLKGL
jgi:nitrous oxide reductase accessory protein NosL